jgi:hypothetical protein
LGAYRKRNVLASDEVSGRYAEAVAVFGNINLQAKYVERNYPDDAVTRTKLRTSPRVKYQLKSRFTRFTDEKTSERYDDKIFVIARYVLNARNSLAYRSECLVYDLGLGIGLKIKLKNYLITIRMFTYFIIVLHYLNVCK